MMVMQSMRELYLSTDDGCSINKMNFFEKKKSKTNLFFRIFSINVNSALFGIGLEKKLFLKNICFEAIQNGSKLNRVLQA